MHERQELGAGRSWARLQVRMTAARAGTAPLQQRARGRGETPLSAGPASPHAERRSHAPYHHSLSSGCGPSRARQMRRERGRRDPKPELQSRGPGRCPRDSQELGGPHADEAAADGGPDDHLGAQQQQQKQRRNGKG